MPDFLRLIRLPNLLIMAFTQYMVRWFLLFPMIDLKRSDLGYSLLSVQMTEQDFFLLVLSTMMIGAAGYIINDYFDVRIDEVNRPATNVVGKTIRRRVAMVAHMALNIIGVGIGLWLSWKYGMLRAGAILYITVPALLWFYSTNLKRQFLIGNLVIAFLSALVPLVVVLFEIPAIYRAFPDLVRGGYLVLTDVLNITLGIAAFAFVVSLLREIIKDTEDYEGDLAYGCKTLPIVLGIAPAKYVMTGLIFIVIGVLGWLQFLQLQAEDWLSFSWFMLLLQLPFVYLAFRIFTATRKSDWRFSSLLLKLIMIAGISYLFVYEHEIRQLIES
ncbi:MAG TPA: geranylgeranylglycerol-phosphate geranylgeranyltransferase [Bacteroidia bacterium]|nr:geranylgeranylglycerol-phosphate geranylgeranyltransferase [Bacteroidia bacterium]